jgi:endonuclease/exonuclease/phosphatase family metal-dependent hydrolase
MKLITLNIWGGRVHDKLEPFFKAHADADIFCFQEVFKVIENSPAGTNTVKWLDLEPNFNLFKTLQDFLPPHVGKFCQTFHDSYGQAVFLKSEIKVLHYGEHLIARGNWDHGPDYTDDSDHHRKAQWFEVKINGKKMLLVNAHLTHRPEGKRDSEKRLRQSKIIVDLLNMFDCPKILVGDFNLMPDTESIAMFERAGLRNLVKEFKVTATRTELYRRFKDGPKFADYIFVSPEITVNDFKVLPDVLSDHSPLYLDFNL